MHTAERHRQDRAPWLRAAVLGANDGIVSIGALVVGVAGTGASGALLLGPGLAGAVGGALSMAMGEYVSVATQRDLEQADIAIERTELREYPEDELMELAGIYEARGLDPDLAAQVAEALHAEDPLRAHLRDELGLDPDALANPWLAAIASATAFSLGAALPLTTALLSGAHVAPRVGIACLVALALTGAWSSHLGGASPWRGLVRVTLGGGLAMALSWTVGALFGVDL